MNNPTSTLQAPYKYPTSSETVTYLIKTLANQQLSIKEMLICLGLKDRVNFLKNYLYPAINDGLVTMLYPNSRKHPKRKYLLTDKGIEFLSKI